MFAEVPEASVGLQLKKGSDSNQYPHSAPSLTAAPELAPLLPRRKLLAVVTSQGSSPVTEEPVP